MCGGIDKSLGIQRLPNELAVREMQVSRTIPVPEKGDAVVFARVTMEDGHVAWSSPIYVYRKEK